jgi:hypothetical protein
MRKEKEENKKNKIVLIAILLLLFATIGLIYFNSGARYTTTATDTDSSVTVGKWSVKINKTDIESESSLNGKITLVPIGNDNVAEGKVVPGTVIYGDIEIDMSGADVSAAYEVEINEGEPALTGLTVLGYESITSGTEAPTTVPEGLDEKAEGTIEYSTTSDNMVKTIRVYVEWTDNSTNNAAQTTEGITAGTATIPVTVKVEQVVPTYGE